ncbi:MAG: DsbA family protein, partial [Pseudomonadota bacterium]
MATAEGTLWRRARLQCIWARVDVAGRRIRYRYCEAVQIFEAPMTIRWYFDFISPYAYLQSTALPQLAEDNNLQCVPVLFAGLLDHWENVGPAEIAPKRDWTFKRVAYLARRHNIALKLPAHHPFNPLPLLRLSIALNNDLQVVQRLFRFVWAEGHLPEGEAFDNLLHELNVSADQLAAPAVKKALHDNGTNAAAHGVFGVPSIAVDDEIFWGYDATDMALSYLHKDNWPADDISAALSLASGQNRKRHTTQQQPQGTRLPLLPIDLAEPADVVAAIRKRRGGELIELDRLLLYSAPLAHGWNTFIGQVRENFTIAQQ